MATLIPISTSSQTTVKEQLEQQANGGWNSWTPEEQGGILAASILVFLFFSALALFISLRVPEQRKGIRLVDAEPGIHERQEGREPRKASRKRGSRCPASVPQTLPGPRSQPNRNTCAPAAKNGGSKGATRRFSSDERRCLEPGGHQGRKRGSTGGFYGGDTRKQREMQRSRSCPGPRDRERSERRVGQSGAGSHWNGRQKPRESILVCDGSDETLERTMSSDSMDSYADGDPGPSTRKGKEKTRTHPRRRSEGAVRIERPPCHMRSYSVN
ncbi:hypothetical protein I7I50_03304 [Histoplasma capsulatum G186AR]|uniref:Uncharacterized protein n=1 Tax=Ajellomyces capsulatus TaxID=5037 RepID=A0A8H7Z5Y1_AJECA|nr:hypothetical protein I7I52_00027 [Histoplasma capsulatum]QSS72204.1 hypothetical protein I7I50_03304 [Histoplasma capsulatum G186AR]